MILRWLRLARASRNMRSFKQWNIWNIHEYVYMDIVSVSQRRWIHWSRICPLGQSNAMSSGSKLWHGRRAVNPLLSNDLPSICRSRLLGYNLLRPRQEIRDSRHSSQAQPVKPSKTWIQLQQRDRNGDGRGCDMTRLHTA